MLDIGWSELLVLAVLAVVVVGPRDLPVLMRTMGRYTTRIRQVAREFRRSFDELARETDIKEDLRSIERASNMSGKSASGSAPATPSSTERAAAAFAPRPDDPAGEDSGAGEKEKADAPDGKGKPGSPPESGDVLP